MKILLIGSGGREHALGWKLAQSPLVKKIYCAPGNPGLAELGDCLDIKADDIAGLADFALKNAIDLTVVGPDDCLAAGVADVFQEKGLKIFGPTQKAAQIEASKAFSKELMRRAGIPTAEYAVFEDHKKALNYLKGQRYPLVIKASGLALGKGAIICRDAEEAQAALHSAMVKKIFGASGDQVIIEEFLGGPEASIHAFCDGSQTALFPASQDHKQAFDGDLGPNTGGMGSYAPVGWVTPEMMYQIKNAIVTPALKAMSDFGAPFRGCLFPGLVYTPQGFKALEFNARFGDPETQSYLRLLQSDLAEILLSCAEGRLKPDEIKWSGQSAACIVAASGGYPGKYQKGFEISGLEKAGEDPDIKIFQAGTAVSNNKLVTAGGRVLGVSAVGDDLEQALAKGYRALEKIDFSGMHYRKDIGRRRTGK
ncbi:phosphoribosylamine--glycine ligase [candidate division TA06 bacterium]|uniref:Phosphoribosylamine--glycine ligase n=1 Tax=candidate division TA06 bacterium TaxID=2250710 RepID=A0A933I9C7_UNCT6|nr:phosphoribosylamine--glycine ligase [candidate division TA06 bacterium]